MSGKEKSVVNKIIIVAALGYFVDIYDLLLFGVERTESLREILRIQFPNLIEAGREILNHNYLIGKWPECFLVVFFGAY